MRHIIDRILRNFDVVDWKVKVFKDGSVFTAQLDIGVKLKNCEQRSLFPAISFEHEPTEIIKLTRDYLKIGRKKIKVADALDYILERWGIDREELYEREDEALLNYLKRAKREDIASDIVGYWDVAYRSKVIVIGDVIHKDYYIKPEDIYNDPFIYVNGFRRVSKEDEQDLPIDAIELIVGKLTEGAEEVVEIGTTTNGEVYVEIIPEDDYDLDHYNDIEFVDMIEFPTGDELAPEVSGVYFRLATEEKPVEFYVREPISKEDIEVLVQHYLNEGYRNFKLCRGDVVLDFRAVEDASDIKHIRVEGVDEETVSTVLDIISGDSQYALYEFVNILLFSKVDDKKEKVFGI